MDYTSSDAYLTHVGTGHRMHQSDQPVPTSVSSDDMNMVIWSLMEILNSAGVAGANFDPDTPATYQKLQQALDTLFAKRKGVEVTLFDYGGTMNGVASDSVALASAVTALNLLGGGVIKVPRGCKVRLTTAHPTLTRISIVGEGTVSDHGVAGSVSQILLAFDGDGIVLGDDSQLRNIWVRKAAAGRSAGDGVCIMGTRATIDSVACTDQPGKGFRVGKANTSVNCNAWVAKRLHAGYNGSHGFSVVMTNTNTSSSFPSGAPDVNAGLLLGIDSLYNGGNGLDAENCINNWFLGVVSQHNAGFGINLHNYARGNRVEGYIEQNTLGACNIDATSEANDVKVDLAVGQATVYDAGLNNKIRRHLNRPFYGAGLGYLTDGKYLALNTSAANEPMRMLAVDSNNNEVADIQMSNPVGLGTGGQIDVLVKVVGGALRRICRMRDDIVGWLVGGFGMQIGRELYDTTTPGVSLGGTLQPGRIDSVNTGTASDLRFALYNANGQVGAISTNGSATTYSTSSDYRLKQDIVDADRDASLAEVMRWRVREFAFKAAPEERIVGFIAHELQEHQPQAVVGEKDAVRELPTYDELGNQTGTREEILAQGVDESRLVPHLIAAVQALCTIVEDQQGRIQALENAGSN